MISITAWRRDFVEGKRGLLVQSEIKENSQGKDPSTFRKKVARVRADHHLKELVGTK